MFNLGLPEIIILGVVALLIFGPRRLPELAKGLGKGLRDFKKAVSGDFDEPQAPTEVAEPQLTEAAPTVKKSAKKRRRA